MQNSGLESSVSLIEEILEQCSKIAVKKLANNDRRWADSPENGHQNGPYIPTEFRMEDFFPPLENINPLKPHILECTIQTCWIRTGELKDSRLVNYSNKGKECHLTRVVKSEFAGIYPSSWLIIGRHNEAGNTVYYCLVIDSADHEGASYLETVFDLESDFEYSLFDRADITKQTKSAHQEFIEELINALTNNNMDELLLKSTFPKTSELATLAQLEFLEEFGLEDLNPFNLECPGNVLMKLSRDIEYRLFRQYSARHYSVKLLSMLSGGKSSPDMKTIITELVTRFDEVYKEVMVSACQRSKSRAGYSFEQHVQRMLKDGNIPFSEQRLIGNQRPDFIVPSIKYYKDQSRDKSDALILSLKTLLRERWKQVLAENKSSDLYLGTVDDSIANDSVAEMKTHGIYLVVPEALKDSDYTEYKKHDNVITFRDFFDTELFKREKVWIDYGIDINFNKH